MNVIADEGDDSAGDAETSYGEGADDPAGTHQTRGSKLPRNGQSADADAGNAASMGALLRRAAARTGDGSTATAATGHPCTVGPSERLS